MKRWCLLLLAISLFTACGKQEEAYQPGFSEQAGNHVKEYVVGIHPLHNPKRLFEVYGPIVAYIEANIPGVRLNLEASRNYEEFDKKLDSVGECSYWHMG